MDISVRVSDRPDVRERLHFCSARGCEIGIEFDGALHNTEMFCPLCGAPAVEPLSKLPDYEVDKCPAYDGRRCAHGMPDAPCPDVVRVLPDYEYEYLWGVPEFQALRWTERLAIDPGLLTEWARPCVTCRAAFAAKRYAVLEHDLRRLWARLSQAGVDARKHVAAVSDGMALVRELLSRLDDRKNEIRADSRSESLGYVYAISDGIAIKIGWSTTHPTRRMAQLQTACPNELKLVGAFLGLPHEERSVHDRFSEHRIRGEWFKHVDEIVDYFTGNP